MRVAQLPKAVKQQLKAEGYRKQECGWKVVASVGEYGRANGYDGRWGGGSVQSIRPFMADVCRTHNHFCGHECQTVMMGTATAIAALWGFPVVGCEFREDTNGGIVADWLEESGLYHGGEFHTLLGILRGDIK